MSHTFPPRALRTYVDTSVFGGCFDEEFEGSSRSFFDHVAEGRFIVLISELTLVELRDAPPEVDDVRRRLSAECLEFVAVDEEVLRLSRAYIEAGILTSRQQADTIHVAAATVAKADLLISWNFRHLVNVNRIRGIWAVNLMRGYSVLDIRSPLEVDDEEEI